MVGACGKKGAPLAPFVRVPTRILDVSARRMGHTVYVKFTVPAANQDGTTPADLERVDVFAYTAAQPTDSPTLKNATLIATVPVSEPPRPDENAPPEGATPPPRGPGLDQGAIAVVTETLGPVSLQVVAPEPSRNVVAPIATPLTDRPLISPLGERPPTRFYAAVPVSRRGRKGAPSGRVAVSLVSPPPAPTAPALRYDETTLVVLWSAPFDSPQPVQTPDEPGEQPSRPRGVAVRAVSYNVYEIKQEPAPSETNAAASATQPTPINEKPLQTVRFDDSRMTFGVERCYAVRLVDTFSELSVESEASPPTCVTPVDTFPPPAPASLATIASEGAIDLIWEPVSASDLAGYVVLRGRAPGETLQPLTPTPIRQAFFHDTTVERGVRYVYEVVAVDNAERPNRSAPSNRQEEAAR